MEIGIYQGFTKSWIYHRFFYVFPRSSKTPSIPRGYLSAVAEASSSKSAISGQQQGDEGPEIAWTGDLNGISMEIQHEVTLW